jgi:hypothetical protein
MLDTMTETHDLRISVLRTGASPLCVSHIVYGSYIPFKCFFLPPWFLFKFVKTIGLLAKYLKMSD